MTLWKIESYDDIKTAKVRTKSGTYTHHYCFTDEAAMSWICKTITAIYGTKAAEKAIGDRILNRG